MHEVPIVFVLAAVGTRRQWLHKREPEASLRLWMRIEDVSDDLVHASILPDELITPKPEEVHPRRETDLITRERAVGSEAARRVHVAVMGQIGFVRLLDPQRDRLRDQPLEFDAR